jgi:hypothetical protein
MFNRVARGNRIAPIASLPHRRQQTDAGFLLPMAMIASMGLLLSSLSLQTTALQYYVHFRSQVQERSDQDKLSQASQRLVSELNLHYPCLINQPDENWLQQGSNCITANRASALIQGGNDPATSVRMVDWQPDADRQEVLLMMELPSAPQGTGRRGLFLVRIGGEPLHAWSIQEQAWLGGQS